MLALYHLSHLAQRLIARAWRVLRDIKPNDLD